MKNKLDLKSINLATWLKWLIGIIALIVALGELIFHWNLPGEWGP